jgi:small redox-active disulfide protein 2
LFILAGIARESSTRRIENVNIIILGPGCANCKKLEQIAKGAVAGLNLQDVTFEKVSNYDEIMKYPILSTPGLVINGKLVSSGRVPTRGEVESWITAALAESKA